MVIREAIHGYLCFKEKKEHEISGRILCRILCRIFTYNPHSINEIDKTLCRICVFAYIFVTNATGTAKNRLITPLPVCPTVRAKRCTAPQKRKFSLKQRKHQA
jgi:hypothetical protein